jgi:hypothetical protein
MEISEMIQSELPERLERSSSAKKATGRKRKGPMSSPSAANVSSPSSTSPSLATPKNKKMRLNSSSRKKSPGTNTSQPREEAEGTHPGAREHFIFLKLKTQSVSPCRRTRTIVKVVRCRIEKARTI